MDTNHPAAGQIIPMRFPDRRKAAPDGKEITRYFVATGGGDRSELAEVLLREPEPAGRERRG